MELRPIDDWHCAKPIYYKVIKTSGVCALVSIKSDKWFRNLEIYLTTMKGDYFELPIYTNALPIHTKHNKALRNEAIEKYILPHLYLTYLNEDMRLHYDERCGQEFMTLLVKLHNDIETSVIMGETDDLVIMSTSEPEAETQIAKRLLTKKDSIFQEDP